MAHLTNRTMEQNVPKASSGPSAVYVHGILTYHIAYRDHDNQIVLLLRDIVDNSRVIYATQNSGAPAAKGNPFIYTDKSKNCAILFRGQDNAVRSIYLENSGHMGNDNLSGTAGSPPASGDPIGYYSPFDNSSHVIYPTSNGHLHELWWIGLQPVSNGGDLIQLASAPNCNGRCAAFCTPGGTNIVVYRDTSNYIRSIYWNAGGNHGVDNLSGVANTPLAKGSPHGYYSAENDAHQVVYLGEDGHLWELYWIGNAVVQGWNITAGMNLPDILGNVTSYYSPTEDIKRVIFQTDDGKWNCIAWGRSLQTPILDVRFDKEASKTHSAAGLRIEGHPSDQMFGFNDIVFLGNDQHIYDGRWVTEVPYAQAQMNVFSS
jgi:hypothetical protein